MNNDLINRKAVLEVIDISFIIPILKMNLRPEHEAVLKIREIIMNMPTAFDKEKVIEELENYLFEKYCVEGDENISEIVEKGGI